MTKRIPKGFVLTSILQEFSELDNVAFLNKIFEENGWQLLKKNCENGEEFYQLYFGEGVQVDNLYEYAFPYLFDKDTTYKELERLVNYRIELNNINIPLSNKNNELDDKLTVLNSYKIMPEWHKNNIKNYYILAGIYTEFPNICDEDALVIYSICQNIYNKNLNPFSISCFLTEHYASGDIAIEDLKKADSSEIVTAFYYNSLIYISSYSEEKNIEICQ